MTLRNHTKHTAQYLWLKASAMKKGSWLSIGLMIVGILLTFMETSWADHIFTKPTALGNKLQGYLVGFGKVVVGVAFLCSLIGSISGRVNWRWTGAIFGVGVALTTYDLYMNFVGISSAPVLPAPANNGGNGGNGEDA